MGCGPGPVMDGHQQVRLQITVGHYVVITGKVTLLIWDITFEVVPAVAVSAKYFLVFSRVAPITDFLLPLGPSSNAVLVSCRKTLGSST